MTRAGSAEANEGRRGGSEGVDGGGRVQWGGIHSFSGDARYWDEKLGLDGMRKGELLDVDGGAARGESSGGGTDAGPLEFEAIDGSISANDLCSLATCRGPSSAPPGALDDAPYPASAALHLARLASLSLFVRPQMLDILVS